MPLCSSADIALDCAFDFKERDLLNAACVRWGKPMVEAAMNSMEAYLTTIVPGQTPLSHLPLSGKNRSGTAGALGCWGRIRLPWPASPPCEAVKLITGLGDPLLGQLLNYGPGPGRVRPNAAPTMTPTVRFVELSPGKPWPTNFTTMTPAPAAEFCFDLCPGSPCLCSDLRSPSGDIAIATPMTS